MIRERIETLDICRCIAFLFGVFSHSGSKIIGAGGACWAVSVFFILSGFSLTYNYYKYREN